MLGTRRASALPLGGLARRTGGTNWMWWAVRTVLVGSVLLLFGGVVAMLALNVADSEDSRELPISVSLARGKQVKLQRREMDAKVEESSSLIAGRRHDEAKPARQASQRKDRRVEGNQDSNPDDWFSKWAEKRKQDKKETDEVVSKQIRPQSPCPYFESIDSTSMTVRWRFPRSEGDDGDGVRSCLLTYKQVSYSKRTESKKAYEGTERQALITNLMPATEYEFVLTCRMSAEESKKEKESKTSEMSAKQNMLPCRRRMMTRGESNLVANPSFEEKGSQLYEKYFDESYMKKDPDGYPSHWQSMMTPIELCEDRVRSGEKSLCLKAPDKSNYKYAATQFVLVNSSASFASRSEEEMGEESNSVEAKGYLVLSAWSAAKEVSGKRDGGYSMVMQIHFADGTHSYGHKMTWRTDDHRWERECLIVETPRDAVVLSVNLFILFLDHSGTVWFDDVSLAYATSAPDDLAGCPREKASPVNHGCCPNRFTFPSQQPPVDPTGVSIATQLTIDRLPSLRMMAQNWDGPISAAVFLTDATQLEELFYFRSTWEKLSDNVDLHVVISESNYAYKTLGLYPVNTLRNIALTRCRTQFAIILDADFIPSPGSFDVINGMVPKLKQSITPDQPGHVWVIPAFEIESGVPLPDSKQELKQLVYQGLVRQVHEVKWAPAHGPTNYSQWMESSSVYEITYKPEYEPYMMVERDNVPLYDERFIGYGYDKVAHAHELHVAGYRFFGLPEVFVTHFDHGVPKWRGKGDVMRSRVFQNFYAFMGEVDLAYKLWPPRRNARKWRPVDEYDVERDVDEIRALFKSSS